MEHISEVRRFIYERYKLWWVFAHGFTMDDIYRKSDAAHHLYRVGLREYVEGTDDIAPHRFGPNEDMIWLSFDQFFTEKYRDIAFVQTLIGIYDNYFDAYYEDVTGKTPMRYIDALNLVESAVKLGVLQLDEDVDRINVCRVDESGPYWTQETREELARDLRYDGEGQDVLSEAIRKATYDEQ